MKTVFTILALFLTSMLSAQTIESFSIDSGGTTSTVGNIKIIYTIGEVNIQEHSVGNITLSEGFINSNFISSTLGIEEDLLTEQIIIFPNPTSDIINIKTTLQVNNIEFFDFLGRKVFTSKETTQVRINHFPSGVYLIKIDSEKGKLSKRVIIK